MKLTPKSIINIVTIHCIVTEYPLRLEFFIPKPPVPAVPNVVFMASNTGIFAAISMTNSISESPRYIIYKILAVCFTFGTSLPTDGPGLSALIRLIFEPPLKGTMAMINTSTPIPPIQCEKHLHVVLQRDTASTSLSILAPVVVKPDTISNKAFINDGISPVIIKGIAPITPIRIQLKDVATQPSLR